jgi:hypothetical protein
VAVGVWCATASLGEAFVALVCIEQLELEVMPLVMLGKH